jgi:GNAT superfamily N-acetyltransferase
MVTIIQAKSHYLKQICAMILELAKFDNILDKIKISESQLKSLLFCKNPVHFVNIALINKQPCGMVLFNYVHSNVCFNLTPGLYIEMLYVSSEFRKQGIGTALLSYVASKASEANCSRIEWWVSKHNQEAANFYNRMGAFALVDWQIYKCDQAGINNWIELGSNP